MNETDLVEEAAILNNFEFFSNFKPLLGQARIQDSIQ